MIKLPHRKEEESCQATLILEEETIEEKQKELYRTERGSCSFIAVKSDILVITAFTPAIPVAAIPV
jgi:hypothetical protein